MKAERKYKAKFVKTKMAGSYGNISLKLEAT